MIAALVELPGFGDADSARLGAEQLPQRVSKMQLRRRDDTWMAALRLCLRDRDTSQDLEVARLMAFKQQWEFVAKRYESFNF